MTDILDSYSAMSRFKAREGVRKDEYKQVSDHILISKIKKELFKWLENTENLMKGVEIASKNTKSIANEYYDVWIKNKIDKKLFILKSKQLRDIWEMIQEGEYKESLDSVLYMRVKI